MKMLGLRRSKTGDSSGEPASERPAGRRRWSAFFRGTAGLLALGFLAGAVSLLALEEFDMRTSTTEFCISCHSTMGETVYKELQQSRHYTNAVGVRPSCGDCHVAGRLLHATWEHGLGAGDLFSQLTGNWTPEKFEAERPRMAEKARLHFLDEGSETCLHCHVMEAIQPQRKRGQRAHADAIEKGKTNCIACHYNLVHKEVPLSERFIQAIKEYGVD